MENYSLADIAAASGNEGFGGNMGFFWIFALLLLANGGFGFGNNGLNQYATAASQQEILFGQQFQNLNSAINKVGDGISSLGYSQLQQMDNNTCAIKEAVHAEGEATRSLIQQNKIEALQSRLNTVEMQQAIGQATAGVVKYPMATTYSSGTNPFCGCGCNAI